jgi:predicted nucleic acid-binding protein
MSVDFIDSNVLIYLFDETDARKQRIAEQLVENGLREASACISYQVVQEVLNVVTRRFEASASAGDARMLLDHVLLPLWRIMPSQALYHRALDVQDRYDYGFYDSLIIAGALQFGCRRLYTEDLQASQAIEQLTIENPFAVA